MTKQIFVNIRNVYGKETIYPACNQSKLLAELANHKTLTQADLRIIRGMGFEVLEAAFDARRVSALVAA